MDEETEDKLAYQVYLRDFYADLDPPEWDNVELAEYRINRILDRYNDRQRASA